MTTQSTKNMKNPRQPHVIGARSHSTPQSEPRTLRVGSAKKTEITIKPSVVPTRKQGKTRPSSALRQRPWTKGEISRLLGSGICELNLADVSKTLSDEQVVEFLATTHLNHYIALNLLESWVEMVLRQAYVNVLENEADGSLIEGLAVELNPCFLPGSITEETLADNVGSTVSDAQIFLQGLRDRDCSSVQGPGSHKLALQSLGWLIREPEHTGLVLCWDELLPQARMRSRWEESLSAEVARRNKQNLRLCVYPPEGNPRMVTYSVQGLEAEHLRTGDWVRYWEDGGNGAPLVLSETPLSPYVAKRREKWNDVDESTYSLDPLPVG